MKLTLGELLRNFHMCLLITWHRDHDTETLISHRIYALTLRKSVGLASVFVSEDFLDKFAQNPQKPNVSKNHAERNLCFDDGRPVVSGLFRGLSGEVAGWRWNLLAIILPDTTLWWNYNMTSWKNSSFFSIGDTSSLLVHFFFDMLVYPEGLPCCSWKWMATEDDDLLLGRPGLVSAPKASPHVSVKPRTTTLSPKTVTIPAAHWWTFGWKMVGKWWENLLG